MKKNKILLFDIDGTLLNLNGAGIKSLACAFYDMFKIPVSVFHNIDCYGKTDPVIYEEIIGFAGVDKKALDENLEKLIERYIFYLLQNVKDIKETPVIAGVEDFLMYIKNKTHIISGLLTGNIEQGAYVKISQWGLSEHFRFGAYGSDSKHREELVNIALNRMNEIYSFDYTKQDVYVIGDTPLDIRCAKINNVNAVAVATGRHSKQELEKYNPEFIVGSLMDLTDVII